MYVESAENISWKQDLRAAFRSGISQRLKAVRRKKGFKALISQNRVGGRLPPCPYKKREPLFIHRFSASIALGRLITSRTAYEVFAFCIANGIPDQMQTEPDVPPHRPLRISIIHITETTLCAGRSQFRLRKLKSITFISLQTSTGVHGQACEPSFRTWFLSGDKNEIRKIQRDLPLHTCVVPNIAFAPLFPAPRY